MERVGTAGLIGSAGKTGRREDGLDRYVPTAGRKSANRPLLFARSFSASASGPKLLGKSPGRREPREDGESQRRMERVRKIRSEVGDELARGAP